MRAHEFIIEKRKNPENNPKISAYDYLLEYKDDDSIYISFTTIPKLGINPKSKWRTPLGIYAYPLKASWYYYKLFSDIRLQKLPFASNEPYIHIFSHKGNGKLLTDLESYTTDELYKDISKLIDLYPDKIPNIKRIALAVLSQSGGSKPFYLLWRITNELTNDPLKWNSVFRKLGYDGFSDTTGTRIIHNNEPVQSVFFSINAIDVIDTIKNINYKKKDNTLKINLSHDLKNKTEFNSDEEKDHVVRSAINNGIRVKKLEPYILTKKPDTILVYATNVLKRKWPEAERIFVNHPSIAAMYATNVLKRRWPEAEQNISKDPFAAIPYIKYIIKNRWPEAEPSLKTNQAVWDAYLEFLQENKLRLPK
jgi:hypothetical protein